MNFLDRLQDLVSPSQRGLSGTVALEAHMATNLQRDPQSSQSLCSAETCCCLILKVDEKGLHRSGYRALNHPAHVC